jgi:hypothetical protein
MQYMILDSFGNALASFDDDATARATLHAMVAVEPDSAEHVVLLDYDDEGMPVGEAKTVFDVPLAVTVEPSEYLISVVTKAAVRGGIRRQTMYFGFVPARERAHVATSPVAV